MERRVVRYSEAFKRQVVEEVESGVFASASAAALHYGIGTCETVARWLKRFGRGHLIAKVVRVERPEEVSEVVRLRRQVRELESALAKTHVRALLTESFLEIACERAGVSVEDLKKKTDTTPSSGPLDGKVSR